MANKSNKEMFKELSDKLGGLGGEVSLKSLFDDTFIQNNSSCKNVNELFDKAGFKNQDEFDSWLETDEAEEFVRSNTKFDSWTTMISVAFMQYLQRKAVLTGWKLWDKQNTLTGDLYEKIYVTFDVTPEE